MAGIFSEHRRAALDQLRQLQNRRWASRTPAERIESLEDMMRFAEATEGLRPPARDRSEEKYRGILGYLAQIRRSR